MFGIESYVTTSSSRGRGGRGREGEGGLRQTWKEGSRGEEVLVDSWEPMVYKSGVTVEEYCGDIER